MRSVPRNSSSLRSWKQIDLRRCTWGAVLPTNPTSLRSVRGRRRQLYLYYLTMCILTVTVNIWVHRTEHGLGISGRDPGWEAAPCAHGSVRLTKCGGCCSPHPGWLWDLSVGLTQGKDKQLVLVCNISVQEGNSWILNPVLCLWRRYIGSEGSVLQGAVLNAQPVIVLLGLKRLNSFLCCLLTYPLSELISWPCFAVVESLM